MAHHKRRADGIGAELRLQRSGVDLLQRLFRAVPVDLQRPRGDEDQIERAFEGREQAVHRVRVNIIEPVHATRQARDRPPGGVQLPANGGADPARRADDKG